MPHPRLHGDDIARRGETLHDEDIRVVVETEANTGKIISIDVETGEYAIGDDPVRTARKLLVQHPDAAIWTKRIGYTAVYAVGGRIHPVDEPEGADAEVAWYAELARRVEEIEGERHG